MSSYRKIGAAFFTVLWHRVGRFGDLIGWNINNFAHFACLAGDRKETARLTARVTEPIREAWSKDETLFPRCRDWANSEDNSSPPVSSHHR